ncbi:MAG: hypothetical protein A2Y48_07505 [Nitrospirae bacterium RIFCSPLOW2_12_42_9]|nr:MAG: hypothetical protein A2Y48_07505 [Nitrospirae bacterium RIFCSPLOW2_12_42_9]HBI24423.1 hypothetical protein [Nitrospiraceae bacterium]HBI24542.1 hypothetical protein [Nitrospiraceae bacterium]
MTREELFRKNQQLSTEFELYILEHPEIEEKIPDNAMIVLVPEYDQELATKNIELAEANKEPGQTIVYIRITRLRTSRIEGLTLQVA